MIGVILGGALGGLIAGAMVSNTIEENSECKCEDTSPYYIKSQQGETYTSEEDNSLEWYEKEIKVPMYVEILIRVAILSAFWGSIYHVIHS